MTQTAILRFGKFKSRAAIQASQAHCTRTGETRNANPVLTPHNRQLFGTCDQLVEQIDRILQTTEVHRKIRPDATLACEILITASPQWYRQDQDPQGALDLDRITQFTTLATQFLQQEFGDHCISAILHLDETTPHIHAHFVPVHREKGWLSWENWFGGADKLSAWQDKCADYLQPLGLHRGIKGAISHHETMQDFYARIHRPIEVPDLERAFCPPPPEPEEPVAQYYQRVQQQFVQNLVLMQDAIATLVAHAKNEEFALRKAAETRVTLHKLTAQIEDLELELATSQAQRQQLTKKQRTAIAQELLTTAHLILNVGQTNYLKGRHRYILNRRGGFTRIETWAGKRLVHDQDGVATLTPDFTAADLARFRAARDQILLQLMAKVEQQEFQRSQRR